MIEFSARKIKINLSDYDYEKDIENRFLMSGFSDFDREVLEEVLFSPLQIPISKLSINLNCDEKKLFDSLQKLAQSSLFEIRDSFIFVDKKIRKYFESQILKFDDSFIPDIEFLKGILKKVPIDVLPSWYSIPRSSNNIFESILEKYLTTPQTFARHLGDIKEKDPVISGIIDDVYNSKNLKVQAKELKKKYNLTLLEFERYMLILEFSFTCCLSYNFSDGRWKEVVTPFNEWREYLKFIRNTELTKIEKEEEIDRIGSSDKPFLEDLSYLLKRAKKEPISVDKEYLPNEKFFESSSKHLKIRKSRKEYVKDIIEKAFIIGFVKIKDGILALTKEADSWLKLSDEKKVVKLYQHPSNRLSPKNYPEAIYNTKNIRPAEKSILRAKNRGWVYFDDFLKGVMVALKDEQLIKLKKSGKNWEYLLPKYSHEEKKIIKTTVMRWLFEAAIVEIGSYNGRDCFKVTALGEKIFEE